MRTRRHWKTFAFKELTVPIANRLGRDTRSSKLSCIDLEHIEKESGCLLTSRPAKTEETSKIVFSKGDVLFGKLRPYLRKSWLATLDGVCSSEFWVLRPNATNCDPNFLHHLTLSDIFYSATSASTGSKMPRADWDYVSEYPFLIPPISEQKKIGRILDTWKSADEKIRRLINLKVKRLSILRNKMLSGASLDGFKHKSWVKVKLSDVAHDLSDRNNNQFGHERLFAVTKEEGIIPMRDRVKGESQYRCKLVHRDDFAYNPMRLNIGSIARWKGKHPVMVSGDYVVFRCNPEKLHVEYLEHLRQTPGWNNFVRRAGNGSVRIRIYFDELGRFIFKLPSITEQKKIAAILNDYALEIKLLEKWLASLRQQRRGLMQKLFSGDILVKA